MILSSKRCKKLKGKKRNSPKGKDSLTVSKGVASKTKIKKSSSKKKINKASKAIQSDINDNSYSGEKFSYKNEVVVSKSSNKIRPYKSTYNHKYQPPASAKEVGADKITEKIVNFKNKQLNKVKLPSVNFNDLKKKVNIANVGANLNLPKVPNLKRQKLSSETAGQEFKSKIKGVSKTIAKKIERCYDLTIHHASFYDYRNERLLGVDITPNCIYLCQIDALNGKRVLTSLTSVCMEGKFLTQDIAEHSDQYAQSLKDLVKESGVKTKNVALSIPVSQSIVRTVTIPTLKDKEIEKALKYGSLWNNVVSQESNPDDYSIFYQVIRRNKSSQSMDVLFIATKLSDVEIYTNVVKESGLNPVIVDVRSFAISNAFNHKLNNPHASEHSVFLEFGLEENYAMIINSGQANIRQINVKEIHRIALIEDNIDDDLIMEFAIDYSSQVQKILNKYLSDEEIDDVDTLFVLSVVPRVGEIIDKLSALMQRYDIIECNFFDCMKINDDFTISGASARHNLSAWAASIGGALRKVDIFGTSTSNKKYPNMLSSAGSYAFAKRVNYCLSALAMLLTVSLTYIGTNVTLELNSQQQQLSKHLAKYNDVKTEYSYIAGEYSEIHKESKKINSVISLIKDAGESQQKILSVYKYMNLVILDDIWLREIRYTSPHKIEIVGGSDNDRSILEFMQLLNEGEQFNKVALKGMKEIREVSIHHADVVDIKTFKLESTLTDIPMYDFNDVNLLAGDMNSGS